MEHYAVLNYLKKISVFKLIKIPQGPNISMVVDLIILIEKIYF